MNTKKGFLIGLIIIVILIFTSCGKQEGEIGEKNLRKNNFETKKKAENVQEIKESISIFSKNVSNEDLKGLKEMIDASGIYSVTYFSDGRDKNIVLHLKKEEIRKDLILANSIKMGNNLIDYIYSKEEIKNISIYSNEKLGEMSFEFDWHSQDEKTVEKNSESIFKTCTKILLNNNENRLRVFKLKGNMYALTDMFVSEFEKTKKESDEDFIKRWAVQEYNKEFTGKWLILEKVNKEYKIRGVINFQ